jgi:hypothetical protein
MTRKIANYLGKPASTMLEAAPFKTWPVEKSFEEDLEEPEIHYVFQQHGLAMRCDRNDKINVIFLYSDEYNGFDESLLELPFSWNRRNVLEHWGTPSKSGSRTSDQILGDYGAWDRFAMSGYEIHVEYQTDSDSIKMFTLMRDDVVP